MVVVRRLRAPLLRRKRMTKRIATEWKTKARWKGAFEVNVIIFIAL